MRDKLLAIERELNQEIIGRPDVTRSIILSVLARQHVMLIGPPGNGKTYGFELFFGRVKGANIFNTQIHAASSPDEVLGPASIKKLREDDRIVRNFDGMFPSADYAIMDEFWNMPETLAGSMLRALNEREVFDGSKFQKIPLRMMVVASNKLPYGEGFLAALDRITSRVYLPAPAVSEGDLFKEILTSSLNDEPTTISLEEIDAATSELMSLPISDEFFDLVVNEIRPALLKAESGLTENAISPRRWKQGLALAKALAWLEDCDEVQPEHAVVYKDVVWNKEPQIKTAHSVVMRYCNSPTKTLDGNLLSEEVKAVVEGHKYDMVKAVELADTAAAAAAITNKTRLWSEKLNDIRTDWHKRFRHDSDYQTKMSDLDLASQMMGGCAQQAYEEVMNG